MDDDDIETPCSAETSRYDFFDERPSTNPSDDRDQTGGQDLQAERVGNLRVDVQAEPLVEHGVELVPLRERPRS